MIPIWLPLTLLSAFFLATSDALTKKALAGHNEYLVTWLRLLPALPFFLMPLFFIEIPPLSREFFLCALGALPLEALALVLYTKALKLSPLNLTLPSPTIIPETFVDTAVVNGTAFPYLELPPDAVAPGRCGLRRSVSERRR